MLTEFEIVRFRTNSGAQPMQQLVGDNAIFARFPERIVLLGIFLADPPPAISIPRPHTRGALLTEELRPSGVIRTDGADVLNTRVDCMLIDVSMLKSLDELLSFAKGPPAHHSHYFHACY